MVSILDEKAPPSPRSRIDHALVGLIKDPRDLPFARLIFSALLVLVPFATVVFVLDPLPWWLGAAYLAVLFPVFIDRYTLMLHNTSHRRLFGKGHEGLNILVPLVLGPFMGQTPYTYFAHHIGMHHPENNLPDDLSSTMRFRRDSLRGFLVYYGTFMGLGIVQLVAYHRRRGHSRMARMALFGELGWYLAIALLLWLRPWPTLVVFVIPFLLIRFMMMAGNWAQHAFIDAADPANPYRNSITSINTRYNRRCFNDGYHIGHHVKANRHWSEMPSDFEAQLATYRDQGAVVFQGLDYFQIWALLMAKRYKSLARHFVDLSERPRTEAEVIDFLRERTRPIPASR
ncbi:MAG: fatty acid desaturase [Deltaproteobacteria bacterium]|nr:fatty acid desaturase [Deltaproteobacteria bacterium]